jgi:hypothetical protein
MFLQDIDICFQDYMVSQPIIIIVIAVKTSDLVTVFSICTFCVIRPLPVFQKFTVDLTLNPLMHTDPAVDV